MEEDVNELRVKIETEEKRVNVDTTAVQRDLFKSVIEESNNPAALAIEVWDLTVREVQRYNDNQLLDNYVKAAMYVQQLYDMKARVNWVLDETDSLNYIPRTINNLRL